MRKIVWGLCETNKRSPMHAAPLHAKRRVLFLKYNKLTSIRMYMFSLVRPKGKNCEFLNQLLYFSHYNILTNISIISNFQKKIRSEIQKL